MDNHLPTDTGAVIEGQLNAHERSFITNAVLNPPVKPRVALEVGTWLGGGSTLHILRALEQNGAGHLYGIEADSSIYERMVANIRQGAPEPAKRFTPIFGFSDQAIPKWLASQPRDLAIDFVFLDGGNNPMEQIIEFRLLDKYIPVGGQLLSHDARIRKGKFLVPYLQALDNWETQLHDFSAYGMFYARKIREFPAPSSLQAARKKLNRLRLEPKEIAATILPSWLCGAILRMLPARLAKSISDDR
jgi:predicted O-methyltransferase YrrM